MCGRLPINTSQTSPWRITTPRAGLGAQYSRGNKGEGEIRAMLVGM